MERTIRVTGKGKLSVKPDQIRLILTLEDINKDYDETLKNSSVMTEKLRDVLVKLGFSACDLKTSHFNVETEYEGYRDKNNNWKQRFQGYKFTHRMKLEFPADNEQLGKILYALGHCSVKPEFQIEYTISDPEAAKNVLLEKAVLDSKIKAEVLTKASGVRLGDVITIDYSWAELEFVSRPMDRQIAIECDAAAPSGSYNLNIEADDIDVTDTVTVIWSILDK